ncbi:acyltransferase [Comamonas aquatica]|nr:acyltransferase [Comamonas aquatica]
MIYRKDIDGLRAIAVLLVIINHFNQDLLPSGNLGVDIFFVISGYVISSSLYNNPSNDLADLLTGFYVRRIKRLVPALTICVALTGIFICLFNTNPESSLKTGIASLFGLSNIYLYRQATDYFGDSAALNVFTQTWSLSVEEQFYVFFPFIVWFTAFGRSGQKGLKLFIFFIGIAALTSACAFIYLNINNYKAEAFYLMPARFWELAAGCLLFAMQKQKNQFQKYCKKNINDYSGLFLAALLGAMFIPQKFSTYTTLLVVLLTIILIIATSPETLVYKILTSRTAIFFGSISYSLYLWHWSVLSISRWTIGIHWWTAPFQFFLMVLLAIASYKLIEKPLRQAEWFPVRWKIISLGIFSLVGTSLILVILYKPLSGILYTGGKFNLVASGVGTLEDNYKIEGTNYAWNGDSCILSNDSQVGKNISLENCTLGDFENAKSRVIVFGNSFSASFVQAFDKLVLNDGYAVTITSSWGASIVPEIKNTSPWSKANEYYWDNVFPSLISKLRRGDWVFLINDMSEFSVKKRSLSDEIRLTQLEDGLKRISSLLSNRGIRLAVLHGNPFAREANCEPSIASEQWFSPFGGPCNFFSREETIERRQYLDRTLSRLSVQGKIEVVDLIDIFCSKPICTYNAANGDILYRDAWSHPSVEAARLSESIFRKALNPNLPK